MKQCSICKEWKDESEFHKNKAHKDGLKSQCKTCRKEIAHKSYLENKEKYLKGNKTWKQLNPEYKRKEYERRKDKNRSYIDSLKTPCCKCGETRLYVLQFHHIDNSTKDFTLSETNSHGIDAFSKEANKCVCLCANCHFEFHHLYGNNPSDPVSSLTEYLGRNPYEI